MKLKHIFFCLALISIFASIGFSQDDRVANDNAMTNELRKDGLKYETKRAIVWAEKDSLTEQELKEFATLANQGIVGIEKYTGIKFDKKHFKAEKIEYFISSKAGISHTSVEDKPFVYMRPGLVQKVELVPENENTFVQNGGLFYRISFISNDKGQVAHLRMKEFPGVEYNAIKIK